MRFAFERPHPRTLVRVQRPWGEWVLRSVALAGGGRRHEIFLDGRLLMDDADGPSEAALAEVALGLCARRAGLRVLVGGLGFGFTLAAVLRDGRVAAAEVVEIEPALVAFALSAAGEGSRGFPSLHDPRLRLRVGDVRARIARSTSRWDCLLLDVDNGPEAPSARGNAALYADEGLRACRRALAAGGVLAIWSAEPSPPCLERMYAVFGNAEDLAVPTVREGRHLEYHLLTSRRP